MVAARRRLDTMPESLRPSRGGEYKVQVQRRPVPFLFDLDGTLADTLPDIAASANHVRALFALPPLNDAAVRLMVGDGARTLLHRALAELAPDAAALEAAFAAYVAHHSDQCTRQVTLYPFVVEHLTRLRDRGHPLAVVTNKPARFAAAILAKLSLADLLPVLIGGDTLPQQKPDPAPLRAALRQLGASADTGVMVGDGEQDLRAARACGLRAIAVLYGYGDPMRLRAVGADEYWQRFGG
jgi:phosphoglycolate phosphatase